MNGGRDTHHFILFSLKGGFHGVTEPISLKLIFATAETKKPHLFIETPDTAVKSSGKKKKKAAALTSCRESEVSLGVVVPQLACLMMVRKQKNHNGKNSANT